MIKKITISLLTFALLAIFGTIQAQEKAPTNISREQFSEAQANAIAHSLALDDVTTKKFVDIFCAYKAQIRKNSPHFIKESKEKPLTDEQVEQNIKAHFSFSHKLLDIRENFYTKFRKVLTPHQIQRIYEFEKREMDKLASRAKKASHKSNTQQANP